MGPWGLPWFCWPILGLLLPYIIVVTIGIFLIQYAFSWCETDVGGGRESTDEGECAEYEALWAVGLAIVMGIVFCCCFCGVRGKENGTAAEQAPILATEAPPPAQNYQRPASVPVAVSYADKGT